MSSPNTVRHEHEPSRRRLSVRTLVLISIIAIMLGVLVWTLHNPPGAQALPDAVAAVAKQNEMQAEVIDRVASAATPPAESDTAAAHADAGLRAAVDQTDARDRSADPKGLVSVAGVSGVDLLSEPDGILIGHAPAGTQLTATGRTGSMDWLLVTTANEAPGWVAAADVLGFGLDALPVTATIVVGSPVVLSEDVADQPAAAKSDPTGDAVAPVDAEHDPSLGTGASTEASARSATATVSLADSRLNVRAGPGTESVIVAKAYPGERFTVLGRDASGAWILLATEDRTDGIGWVAADYVTVDRGVENLPVSTQVSDAPAFEESGQTEDSLSATSASASSVSVTSTSGNEITGTLVFQTSNGGAIYLYDLTSGALTELTDGFDPALSPDGATVAFTRDGGENGLYLIDSDGGNERLIFSGRAGLRAPTWSPDGQWIAFTRGDESVKCYDMGRMGCPTESEFRGQFPPSFSLDDYPLVEQTKYKLAVVDRSGDNYRDVVALESAQAADWSEAGIVYQSTAGLQITTAGPDAENQLLAFDYLKPFYRDPDWQVNGGKIVFQSKEGSHWEIYTVNADGSGMTALTRPVTTLVDELPSNVAPVWSPDGQQIVFLSNRTADHEAGVWRLWVMDADGGNQRPLPLELEFAYSFGNEQIVDWE